ncbi:MAG: DUF1839 family protein [Chloroflexi bacterium]|nr:DUF1839 family protein [Chloroflexota bacterium]
MIASHDLPAPAEYVGHWLHIDSSRVWQEHNCYVDLWIELLHSLGLNPLPAFYTALLAGFQADQWTFVKPDHWAIARLFGIDVIEVDIWRGVEAHVLAQLENHSVPLLETDCWYLPDTAGMSYQQQHKKSAIAIVAVEPESQVLRYFHNRGFHEIRGADYRGALYLDEPPRLVPYAEAALIGGRCARSDDELRQISLDLLSVRFEQSRQESTFVSFREHLECAIAELHEGAIDFHEYAFANFRQLGSACALGAEYLRWLDLPDSAPTAAALDRISELAQSFILRLARLAARARTPEIEPTMSDMVQAWSEAQRGLHRLCRQPVCT